MSDNKVNGKGRSIFMAFATLEGGGLGREAHAPLAYGRGAGDEPEKF